MRRKGFTLIELIVVIAIIAILAAIIAPNAFKAVEKAKISGTIEDFRSIKTGAMAYYSDVGTWPINCTDSSSCANGASFVSQNGTITGWDGPYLEKWPQTSKWSGVYQWTNDPSNTNFGTPAAGERYVTVTQVPGTAAGKVKSQVDGAGSNMTTGQVHYTNATTTNMQMIVSRDGPIS
jgi:general secretion pathway protein G